LHGGIGGHRSCRQPATSSSSRDYGALNLPCRRMTAPQKFCAPQLPRSVIVECDTRQLDAPNMQPVTEVRNGLIAPYRPYPDTSGLPDQQHQQPCQTVGFGRIPDVTGRSDQVVNGGTPAAPPADRPQPPLTRCGHPPIATLVAIYQYCRSTLGEIAFRRHLDGGSSWKSD